MLLKKVWMFLIAIMSYAYQKFKQLKNIFKKQEEQEKKIQRFIFLQAKLKKNKMKNKLNQLKIQ